MKYIKKVKILYFTSIFKRKTNTSHFIKKCNKIIKSIFFLNLMSGKLKCVKLGKVDIDKGLSTDFWPPNKNKIDVVIQFRDHSLCIE